MTAENKPARSGIPNDNRDTNVASHIRGCMNFICSVPSDISGHDRCRSSPAVGSASPIILSQEGLRLYPAQLYYKPFK